jgi:hypothetical protein
MIPATWTRKLWRMALQGIAERSLRREPAWANSLGRVVPAVWTTAGLASAASPGGKPARAGCTPPASAGRCGIPGFLDVSRGARSGAIPALILRIHYRIHGDPLGRQFGCSESLVQHALSGAFRLQVSGARSGQHLRRHLCRKRSASPGWQAAQPRLSLCRRTGDA